LEGRWSFGQQQLMFWWKDLTSSRIVGWARSRVEPGLNAAAMHGFKPMLVQRTLSLMQLQNAAYCCVSR
jgi:hypothetical protein